MHRTVLVAIALVGCNEYNFAEELPQWPNSIPPAVAEIKQTDEIVQVQTPKVDILWTIDNSCSMSNEQEELTTNFPSFMDYFLGSGLDYHIGVTSTDIDGSYNGADGTLKTVAGVKYIEPDTASPIEVYTAMATLGTMGSGNEKGIGGTYLCLEEKADTTNAGFYRDEAAMHTIVISDEPDMTPDSLITQNEFEDWYDGLKDETDMRSFSSIVDPMVGSAYRSATMEIGGINWDINSGDWPQLLDRLGVQAAGLKREYFLSHLPVPGTIEVAVRDISGAEIAFDEAILDAYDNPTDLDADGYPDGEWYYEHARNSITFLEYIPNSLSTVVVTYTVLAAQSGATDEFEE